MPHATATPHPCAAGCGATVVKVDRGRPIYCAECGPRVAAEAARQMHEKSGPAWDAFQAARAKGRGGIGR